MWKRAWSGSRPSPSAAKRSFASALCLAVCLGSGCATYSEHTAAAREALRVGDYERSLAHYNEVLEVKSSEQLPRELEKDAPLVLLERATVLQATGAYELSARDYQVADKELELLDIARDGAGKIGKYIYSDSATKYKTSPTEKLALNAMNLVNYLARGDLSGAKVEARRFTVMRNYMRDYDPEHEHGAFGSYLAGFVQERLGNTDDALRYYDEALQERDFESLRPVIPRLATRGSYRTDRLARYLEAAPTAAPEDAGEILVVAKVGRVPYKIPQRLPIGAAIGLAGAFITGDPTILEYGMFKVVTYPELVDPGNAFDRATVRLDGEPAAMDLASDLGQEIVVEYEELRPKIIGAALTRMIARAAAAEAARAAGNQAEGAGGLIGFLAAAAVEGTLVALDRPDTRSWTTLPGRVYVGRWTVPAGVHRVEVTVSGPGGRQTRGYEVDVPPQGFTVLDVTTLR